MLLHRILAVNIFALAMLAGSLFYLDGFRSRLTEEAMTDAETEVRMIASALTVTEPAEQGMLLRKLGRDSGTRLRLYRADGAKGHDSWQGAPPTYELRDPASEAWYRGIARALDNGFDAIVG